MTRQEIRSVLRELYGGAPDGRVRLAAAPRDVVGATARRLGVAWTDDEVAVAAAALTHEASLKTIDLLEELREASSSIDDARASLRRANRQSVWMEMALIATGSAILLAALVEAVRGRALTAAALGGLSLTSFLTLFLLDPLRQMQRGVSDLVQLELIYQAHLTEVRHWKPYESRSALALKAIVLSEIRDATAHATWLLQRYVEGDEHAAPPTPNPQEAPLVGGAADPRSKPVVLVETLPFLDEPHPPDARASRGSTPPASKTVTVVEKQVQLEKAPYLEAPSPRPPPKVVVDARVPDPLSAENAPAAPPSEDAPGALPFSLLVPHHAPTWETHDPQALERALERLDRQLDALGPDEAGRAELERLRVAFEARLEKLRSP